MFYKDSGDVVNMCVHIKSCNMCVIIFLCVSWGDWEISKKEGWGLRILEAACRFVKIVWS